MCSESPLSYQAGRDVATIQRQQIRQINVQRDGLSQKIPKSRAVGANTAEAWILVLLTGPTSAATCSRTPHWITRRDASGAYAARAKASSLATDWMSVASTNCAPLAYPTSRARSPSRLIRRGTPCESW